MTSQDQTVMPPTIERVRHELKRRILTVAQIERLPPGMLRLSFTGDDHADFTSLAPDDHIKLLIDNPAGEPWFKASGYWQMGDVGAHIAID